jgi:hypothetical protein
LCDGLKRDFEMTEPNLSIFLMKKLWPLYLAVSLASFFFSGFALWRGDAAWSLFFFAAGLGEIILVVGFHALENARGSRD